MKLAICLLLVSSAFAQDIKRPTFELDAGATVKCGFGTKQTSSPMPLAYDSAGQSTAGAQVAQGSASSSFYKSRSFSAWQGSSSSYSTLVLNINALATQTASTGSIAQAALRYSIDGGATWVGIVTAPSWTRQTFSVTLSPTQDLSLLKAAVCVDSMAGGDTQGANESITVFDIWTLGTTTPQGGGSGSTSASPQRELVIVN